MNEFNMRGKQEYEKKQKNKNKKQKNTKNKQKIERKKLIPQKGKRTKMIEMDLLHKVLQFIFQPVMNYNQQKKTKIKDMITC